MVNIENIRHIRSREKNWGNVLERCEPGTLNSLFLSTHVIFLLLHRGLRLGEIWYNFSQAWTCPWVYLDYNFHVSSDPWHKENCVEVLSISSPRSNTLNGKIITGLDCCPLQLYWKHSGWGRQWIPSLGDNLSVFLIPSVVFIKFFGQRETAEQLEDYIKQMCNGVGSALKVATKNASYREEWRTNLWLKPILNGKAFNRWILHQ